MKAQKGWRGYFFEDFRVGMKLQAPTPRMISTGDTSLYIALTGERTPRFCGAEKIVHPLIVFHAVFGQTVRVISLNALANLGYADLRFLAPVHQGDTLSTQMEIVGLKENISGKSGIVYVRTSAYRQDGTGVLQFVRWVMIKKRDEQAQTSYRDEPIYPQLSPVVPAEHLIVYEETLPTKQICGGRWSFEDYEVGERIHHFDGVTIYDADHTTFTRLFQNSAHLHFDRHKTNQMPVVYGGLIMSHGYAQSFNGLEMRLGIRAINAGTHAHPVHSGDTLYTFTDVIDKKPLRDPRLGALRLRMIVCKNLDITENTEEAKHFAIAQEDPKAPQRLRYHPAVVLALDYWEILPRHLDF